MKNATSSVNVRLLTTGLGLAVSIGAMSPAYGFLQEDVDLILTYRSCRSCDLSGAPLSGKDLRYVDAPDAIFIGANVSYTNFYFGDLRFTDFRNADARGAEFAKANLEYGSMAGANLTGASFYAAKLLGVDRSSNTTTSANIQPNSFSVTPAARITNFTDAIFDEAIATDAFFANANFTGASFKGSDFSGSDLQGGDFTGADLTGGVFENVNLLGATISSSQLGSLASFSGTLPDGTVVVAVGVPESSAVAGTVLVGLMGVMSLKGRKKS